MRQDTKVKIVIAVFCAVVVAITLLLIYALYSDITDPQPKPQHGSYAHCEYRTVKGACAKWITKTY